MDRVPWPWESVEKHFKEERPSTKIPAVVFASGNFGPTHRGHVLMLHQARRRLLELGYDVLGGWISPSHDLSVLADAKARGYPELRHDFRLHLADLSVREDDFISVGAWESSQPGPVTEHDTAKALFEAVNGKFRDMFPQREAIRVFCVCGCDHMAKFRLKSGFGSTTCGVIGVPREHMDEVILEKPNLLVLVADATPGEAAAISSSLLRDAIINGEKEYVKNAMIFDAARCILQPTLQEQQVMRSCFENLGVMNPALDIIAVDGPWPTAKLAKRLEGLSPTDIPAVLIVSGSMSPVHMGHFEVMKAGRARLERAGFKMLAGYLSPQNAVGAGAEMRAAAGSEEETALSTGFRLLTTQVAVVDDDFVSLGAWEASVMGRVPMPYEVMAELEKHLYKSIPQLRDLQNVLRIFYACGPGQASRRGLHKSMSLLDKGVVIVPREDEDCFLLESPANLFYVAEPAPGEANVVVAAKIRAAIQSGNATYVASAVPPAVARYVLSPTASEVAAMKTDFEYLRPDAARGALRIVDAAATQEAQVKFKAILHSWAGPKGSIAIEDVVRLLEVLDPSWTNSELNTFSSGACGAVGKTGKILCDDLVDWMFGVGSFTKE